MRYVVVAAALAVAVLLVLFGVQNPQLVTVRFLSFTAGDLSLSVVIIVAAIFGAALVGLLSMLGAIRRGVRGRRERKERVGLEARVAALEKENAALKGGAPAEKPAATAAKK